MKLTLIGGGGLRAPLFVAAALRRAERIGLDEISLMDTDEEQLQVISAICRNLARTADQTIRITTTTNSQAALDGAMYVVTTIRAGGDSGGILDERIALQHGVLGQETTGPSSFAMAMRSIPTILQYAELMDRYSPGAWLLNFTNPASLVTEALQRRGFDRSIGICDGANAAQRFLARWCNVDAQQLRPEVFGLNHLSWTRRVWLGEEDILASFLQDPAAVSESPMAVFDPALVQYFGMWLNEYLFYFYYSERAVQSIQADPKTRGEEVLELNQRLLAQLRKIDPEKDPQAALQAYRTAISRRRATYMHYARPNAPSMEQADAALMNPVPSTPTGTDEGEGYAGIALDIMEAMETRQAFYFALNVPNQGAIACMPHADVVEVSCVVNAEGVKPLPIGAVPEHQELLMRTVKQYENLAVEAILDRCRATAVLALMSHPLVLSYSRAKVLVDEYLSAHRKSIGEWH